jgi:hypothetical protein
MGSRQKGLQRVDSLRWSPNWLKTGSHKGGPKRNHKRSTKGVDQRSVPKMWPTNAVTQAGSPTEGPKEGCKREVSKGAQKVGTPELPQGRHPRGGGR